MAIKPPNFQVTALSPGALLQGGRRRSGGSDLMQDILGRAMDFSFRKQLQDAQFEQQKELTDIRHENAIENTHEYLRGQGLLTPAAGVTGPVAALLGLPEDGGPAENANVPLIDLDGQQYVPTRAVQGAQETVFNRSPAETYAGFQTLPGTTQGFLSDATEDEIASVTVAPEEEVESLFTRISSIDNPQERARLLNDAVAAAESQGAFTRAEMERFRDATGFGEINVMEQARERIDQLNRQTDSAVFQEASAIRRRQYQKVMGPDGQVSDQPISMQDAMLIAEARVKGIDTLPESMQQYIGALDGSLRTRPDIYTDAEYFAEELEKISDTDSRENQAFAGWLSDRVAESEELQQWMDQRRIPRGSVIDYGHFAEQSAAAPFRALFLLWNDGLRDSHSINQALSRGLQLPLVSLDAVWDAGEIIRGREAWGTEAPDPLTVPPPGSPFQTSSLPAETVGELNGIIDATGLPRHIIGGYFDPANPSEIKRNLQLAAQQYRDNGVAPLADFLDDLADFPTEQLPALKAALFGNQP